MTYVSALVAVICFVIVFERLGVSSVAHRAIKSGLDASRVIRDSMLSDDEKEQAVRGASLVLLRCFCSITVRSAAALSASFLSLVVFDVVGIVRISAVNRLLMSWNGILLASAAVTLMYFARARQ